VTDIENWLQKQIKMKIKSNNEGAIFFRTLTCAERNNTLLILKAINLDSSSQHDGIFIEKPVTMMVKNI